MTDVGLSEIFDFVFMRKALVAVIALSLSAAPMGVFLMLRRMSLMGDAMAHAILPGAAIGYLIAGLSLTAMTIGGLIAGLLVVLLSGLVSRLTTAKEEASLAAFYMISLSLGILLISMKGSNLDLMHVLFGNVLGLDNPTMFLLVGITTLTLLVLALLFRPLVLDGVDPSFLITFTKAGATAHLIFMALLVLNLVGAFHALGTLLAVGILILPSISARYWAQSISGIIGISILFACTLSTLGLMLSYALDLPTSPTITLTMGAGYLTSLLFGPVNGLITQFIPKSHLEG